MTRLAGFTTALVMVAALGCSVGEPRTIASSSSGSERDVIPLVTEVSVATANDAAPMILSSVDGSLQEEVVFMDAPLTEETGVEVFEVPEIIAAALEGAPEIDAVGEGFDQQQLILKSEDGSIQEEVVFVESDDELGSVEEPQEPPSGEVNIATLQVPTGR